MPAIICLIPIPLLLWNETSSSKDRWVVGAWGSDGGRRSLKGRKCIRMTEIPSNMEV